MSYKRPVRIRPVLVENPKDKQNRFIVQKIEKNIDYEFRLAKTQWEADFWRKKYLELLHLVSNG